MLGEVEQPEKVVIPWVRMHTNTAFRFHRSPDRVIAVGDGRIAGKILVFSTLDSGLIELSPDGASPSSTPPAFTPEHLQELVSKLPAARPVNPGVVADWWKSPRTGFSALNLNLTDKCNLACVYCYAKGGDYQRIHQEMSPEAALHGLQQAISHRDQAFPFRIEFFGGEPLLNPTTIARVLAEQPSWGVPVVNRISTNLTVCDPQHRDLLKKGAFIVSISLDGPGAVQDEQRPFKDGRGSYEPIMANIRRLREHCPDQVFVARMTVFRHDDKLLQMVEEFAATDLFDYVSIYPAAMQTGNPDEQGCSHFSGAFRDRFLAVAAAYPRLLRGRFKGVLEVNRYLEDLLTGRAVANHCRAGAGYFTWSPDGSLHPCHRLVGDPARNLGGFDLSTPERLAALKSWQTPADSRAVCSTCQIRYLCGGGCKQQSLIATGDLLGHDPNVCAYSWLLFEAALLVSANLQSSMNTPLTASFAELSRLFVLCGQPALPNHRRLQVLPESILLTGRAFRPRWLEILEASA